MTANYYFMTCLRFTPAWQPSRYAALQTKAGAGSRIRTDDLLITNQLLYQLSYAGIYLGKRPRGSSRRVTKCIPRFPALC
jgi:hypothetical protein